MRDEKDDQDRGGERNRGIAGQTRLRKRISFFGQKFSISKYYVVVDGR